MDTRKMEVADGVEGDGVEGTAETAQAIEDEDRIGEGTEGFDCGGEGGGACG